MRPTMSNKDKKQYGLILPKSKEITLPKEGRPAVFRNESSTDDESTSEPPMSGPVSKYGNTTKRLPKKQEERDAALALAEDPTIFQYDEVYEDIQREKIGVIPDEIRKSDKEKKPKYINNLLKAAARRQRDYEARTEKQQHREREKEGDEFADKEIFVTTAYRKRMEELAKYEAEEKRRDQLDEMTDVKKQKDLSGFYRVMLEEQSRTAEPTDIKEPSTSAGLQTGDVPSRKNRDGGGGTAKIKSEPMEPASDPAVARPSMEQKKVKAKKQAKYRRRRESSSSGNEDDDSAQKSVPNGSDSRQTSSKERPSTSNAQERSSKRRTIYSSDSRSKDSSEAEEEDIRYKVRTKDMYRQVRDRHSGTIGNRDRQEQTEEVRRDRRNSEDRRKYPKSPTHGQPKRKERRYSSSGDEVPTRAESKGTSPSMDQHAHKRSKSDVLQPHRSDGSDQDGSFDEAHISAGEKENEEEHAVLNEEPKLFQKAETEKDRLEKLRTLFARRNDDTAIEDARRTFQDRQKARLGLPWP